MEQPRPPVVYADHAATSWPTLFPRPTAAPEGWANPASAHGAGRAASQALEEARDRIARCLNAPAAPREAAGTSADPSRPHPPPQIVFTANGTEGDNLVLQGYPWDYVITAATE